MSDRLLRELGDMERSEAKAEEARFDERWDRLAAGTLTAEEDAELKALAASSPEAREAYEAFRPLGADFQARVVSAINAERSPKPLPLPQPQPLPKPLPFRLARRIEVWVGSAAAVAAGLFFLVLWPAMAPPLSSGYVASLSGGLKSNRGGEPSPPNEKPVLSPGSPFTLEVSPNQPLEHPGKVKARAFLSSSAGREDLRTLGLENKFESATTGSVLLQAKMGEDVKVPPGPPGDWIFWTVVARKSLPEAREVQERLRANQPMDASWQDICDALKKEEKPPPAPSQVACVGFRAEGQPDP